MASINPAARRSTSDILASSATPGRSRPATGPSNIDARRDLAFDGLIDKAVASIRAAADRPDAVFGSFAEINTLVRTVTYHEGKLLEAGIALLAGENPALVLLPSDTALPIVPAALEMLKRNDWASLEGLRLPSELHFSATYAPDLFLVDRARHSACILDVKRSLASYQERRLNALRQRMMAAALIAADWLHINGRVAGVSTVDVAIIDGSGERRDRATGVFALDEVGELIGVPGAGEAMTRLRAKFACRVQSEVRDACLRAIGSEGEPLAAARGDEDDELATEGHDDDDSADAGRRLNCLPSVSRQPIVVGFARGGPP